MPLPHSFQDKPAKIAFVATVGALAADSAITCHNVTHGGTEQWLGTQSCGKAVSLMAAERVGAWTGAWLAHKTHHHKLERVFEWIGPAGNAAGIAYSVKNGGVR